MIDSLLHLYEDNLGYARRLVDDLTPEQMTAQPGTGAAVNHAAWVLGHLALVAHVNGASYLLGLDVAPESSVLGPDDFGGGSTPKPDAALYPDKDKLLGLLASGHARVAEALARRTAGELDQPTPHPGLAARFPRFGGALTHVLVRHEMLHLGQLSAWRRVQGLPSV
ncbi:MAG: DinB family protein [Planctomycetota bacterium]